MGRGKSHIVMYGAGESDADVLYATRFFSPDPFIYVETPSGRRTMVVSDLEFDRARKTASVHRVLPLTDAVAAARARKRNTPHIADVIHEVLRGFRARSIKVPEHFPAGIVDRLRRRGVTVRTAAAPFYPRRARKSEAEVHAVARAMRAAEAGMSAAVDVLQSASIRDGWVMYQRRRLTSERLRAIANTAIIERGCNPAHTIVASGRRGCDPHDEGSGPIRAHQPIIIDIFPRSEQTGYFGDMTRTFVKGRASDFVRSMYVAVRNAQKSALARMRHGVPARRIHEAVQDVFRARGFTTGVANSRREGFFHGTGHGIGLEIHEPPRISSAVSDVLRAGMTVTVEPGLYYYPHGGVRIEDTVVVTDHGVKNLTRFRKFLEID